MTGDDCDLMLHCTIGNLLFIDGALPDFDDGEHALNLLAPPGEPRYIFCIFCIFFIFCISMISLWCAGTFCAGSSEYMDFGTISWFIVQLVSINSHPDLFPGLTLKWMHCWTASSACMFCVFCIFDIFCQRHILILNVYLAEEER